MKTLPVPKIGKDPVSVQGVDDEVAEGERLICLRSDEPSHKLCDCLHSLHHGKVLVILTEWRGLSLLYLHKQRLQGKIFGSLPQRQRIELLRFARIVQMGVSRHLHQCSRSHPT
jgi:hypothetical protein